VREVVAMKWLITATALGAVLLAGAAWVALRDDPRDVRDAVVLDRHPVAQVENGAVLERLERSAKVKTGSKRSLGTLRLSDGRVIELTRAETIDGKECLIDHARGAGASASCLDDGLFRHRRVEFSIAFEGGPETFDELQVIGVVAPSVRSAELVMTNGGVAPLALTKEHTFVYESGREALLQGVRPTAFRLYGPRGKLVETHRFVPPGS
jgi:hypothetical protein